MNAAPECEIVRLEVWRACIRLGKPGNYAGGTSSVIPEQGFVDILDYGLIVEIVSDLWVEENRRLRGLPGENRRDGGRS